MQLELKDMKATSIPVNISQLSPLCGGSMYDEEVRDIAQLLSEDDGTATEIAVSRRIKMEDEVVTVAADTLSWNDDKHNADIIAEAKMWIEDDATGLSLSIWRRNGADTNDGILVVMYFEIVR